MFHPTNVRVELFATACTKRNLKATAGQGSGLHKSDILHAIFLPAASSRVTAAELVEHIDDATFELRRKRHLPHNGFDLSALSRLPVRQLDMRRHVQRTHGLSQRDHGHGLGQNAGAVTKATFRLRSFFVHIVQTNYIMFETTQTDTALPPNRSSLQDSSSQRRPQRRSRNTPRQRNRAQDYQRSCFTSFSNVQSIIATVLYNDIETKYVPPIVASQELTFCEFDTILLPVSTSDKFAQCAHVPFSIQPCLRLLLTARH